MLGSSRQVPQPFCARVSSVSLHRPAVEGTEEQGVETAPGSVWRLGVPAPPQTSHADLHKTFLPII